MALDFTDRQASTITAAITTVSAVIILVAIGLLGWLAALFLRAFSGVFLPLAVGAIAAMVFRPYYDLLRTTGRGCGRSTLQQGAAVGADARIRRDPFGAVRARLQVHGLRVPERYKEQH